MTKWLSEEQQHDWRAFLSVLALLPDQFSRDLQIASDLTFADYEIFVRLSEREDRSMRMSELANLTLASRSRLTHQIDRLEQQGYVERRACDDDKRGFWATLTQKGWDKLVATAPLHVDSVRAHLVDVLTDEEFKTLGAISRKVIASLDQESQKKSLADKGNC
jgi:DNA-binding MarR family transcriptional regulator